MSHGQKTEAQSDHETQANASSERSGMERFVEEGHHSGRESQGPPSAWSQGCPSEQPIRTDTSEDGNHHRKRHPAGVPFQVEVEGYEARLRVAFEGGDPVQVWTITQALLQDARRLVTEVAQYRFQVNFGTEVCQNCTGLKAGPGVVSTCFQIKQCHYKHLREKDITTHQRGILQALVDRT
jgi:hypothetical protein